MSDESMVEKTDAERLQALLALPPFKEHAPGFECPECRGHTWGTLCMPGKKIMDSTGRCHSIGCSFEWPRREDARVMTGLCTCHACEGFRSGVLSWVSLINPTIHALAWTDGPGGQQKDFYELRELRIEKDGNFFVAVLDEDCSGPRDVIRLPVASIIGTADWTRP